MSATTVYEPCSRCGGHGMEDFGECIGECSTCGGNCYVRARDDRGRFVRVPLSSRPLGAPEPAGGDREASAADTVTPKPAPNPMGPHTNCCLHADHPLDCNCLHDGDAA